MASSTQKAPKVVSVEVVATRPTAADTEMITALAAEANASLREVAYIVKIQLREIPEATGLGWALYAGDVRIPKYWEYPGGIYFKVLDPQFLADHRGKPLRFSQNGHEFVDTGVKLPGPGAPAGSKRAGLPSLVRQDDVLKGDNAPKSQARASRAKGASRKRKTKSR
ncbi:MAG TPA: hypothetical protein VJN96_11915 [Vicinamibacterales bacterium]|nr:hypothetical protein [Vicinamibacterales bacterium]